MSPDEAELLLPPRRLSLPVFDRLSTQAYIIGSERSEPHAVLTAHGLLVIVPISDTETEYQTALDVIRVLFPPPIEQ